MHINEDQSVALRSKHKNTPLLPRWNKSQVCKGKWKYLNSGWKGSQSPHPFHILPKPIVISHPSFFPRCQIFPKVALGACAMTRDRTFSSRSYFGLFLLIFQNPLKARLARNATNPRLSLGVRYLPFTTPTSSWAQLYEFWKASLKGYHQHHDDEHQHQRNIITIIIIMEGWQWDAFVSWPLPE